MPLNVPKTASAPTVIAPTGRTLLYREKLGSLKGPHIQPYLRGDFSRCAIKHQLSTRNVYREFWLLSQLMSQKRMPRDQINVEKVRARYQMMTGTSDFNASHLNATAYEVNWAPPSIYSDDPVLTFHLNVNEGRTFTMPRTHNRTVDLALDRGELLGTLGLDGPDLLCRGDAMIESVQKLLGGKVAPDRAMRLFKEREQALADRLADVTVGQVASAIHSTSATWLGCGTQLDRRLDEDTAARLAADDSRLGLVTSSFIAFRETANKPADMGDVYSFARVVEAARKHETTYEGPTARASGAGTGQDSCGGAPRAGSDTGGGGGNAPGNQGTGDRTS